jgi:hypothetical protein
VKNASIELTGTAGHRIERKERQLIGSVLDCSKSVITELEF